MFYWIARLARTQTCHQAIYEGICFSHRYHIEKLLKYLSPPEAARIAGGASKSYEWAQMFADVLQMPIEVPKTSELGTLGAVICAAVGAGYYPNVDEAVAGMVKIAGVVTRIKTKKRSTIKNTAVIFMP